MNSDVPEELAVSVLHVATFYKPSDKSWIYKGDWCKYLHWDISFSQLVIKLLHIHTVIPDFVIFQYKIHSWVCESQIFLWNYKPENKKYPLYTGLNIFKLGHIDHAEIIMKLLVCGKHLYDHILSSRGVVRIHKISLPPPHLWYQISWFSNTR
jgi:hypothetical protein